MKPMISHKRMYKAFIQGGLGDPGIYHLWTPIWAVRSRIWRRKGEKKHAARAFGEAVRGGIEEGSPVLLRQLADAIEAVMQFERDPANCLRADIYYAIEELNQSGSAFSRADVLRLLKDNLLTGVDAGTLDRELRRFGLDDVIPKAKEKPGRGGGTLGSPGAGDLDRLAEVRQSGIHQRGLFARRSIPKGARVIEYIGDRVIKPESERRSNEQMERATKTGEGGVYVFTLNDRYDIDGSIAGNIARFANHSCDPNCETDIIDDRIWVIATRDIRKGEEIVYNYNFDLDHYEDHPCRCGAKNCVGFIVGEEHWPKLRSELARKAKKSGKTAKGRKAGKTRGGRK